MLEILSTHRRFIVTGILIFFSLGFLGFFTESDRFSPILQVSIVSIFFFLVIPILYSKMVLKESLESLGFQRGATVAGVLTSIVSVVVALGVVVGLSSAFPALRAEYVFPVLVENSFFWFVFYELVLTLLVVLMYEVFFRGLVQLFWLRELGIWAVFVQAGIFFALFYLSSDISWQKAPLLIFCPLAGLIAHNSRSLWYSIVASWTFLFLTDIFFLIAH